MSCSLWNWTPDCDLKKCPGDCDICEYDLEDTYTIEEESGTVSI